MKNQKQQRMSRRTTPTTIPTSLRFVFWIAASSTIILSSSSSSSSSSFCPPSWVAFAAAEEEGEEPPNSNCERLKVSLTYTQEDAPRDLSGVLPVVVEKVNKVLDGVVDVEVEWQGADLQGRVGEHIVECTVTRLVSAIGGTNNDIPITTTDEHGRKVTSQCFHVPFTILDTNECALPVKHPMRHACSSPSICVNTEGSYECLCPRAGEESSNGSNGSSWMPPTTADASFWKKVETSDRTPWELSFSSSSKTSCPSMASTHGCCPQKYTPEGKKCRERFRCPIDPCQSKKSDCAPNAQCVRADNPAVVPNHSCVCPDGLMGNGLACKPNDPPPKPMVMYDGVTPTDLTLKNNYYCGCTKPTVDACSGFPPCKGKHEICTVTSGNQPKCACKPGFVHIEKYGCVDVNPPTMQLLNDPNGDGVMRLKQGDEYKESMVQIVDDNAEDYLRSLKVAYSEPLPPGCLTSVGEFTVTYTISLPWATPPYVRVTRKVVIEDIDECSLDVAKYRRICPQLIPRCDTEAGAQCKNTIGSYTCQCPANTSGDGFLKNATFTEGLPAPSSFKGGTSCVDTTKPVMTLQGPNPKVFKVCSCGGLDGVMSSTKDGDDDKQLQGEQRKLYEADIREMIRATAGAELCATLGYPHPSPSDCVHAVDHTYKGDVDLSDHVTIGEPVAKSPMHWVVPYDVTDAAGNKAATVYRDIMVQEVNLNDMEKKIREEVTKEQQQKTKRAIDAAVLQERKRWERDNTNRNRRSSSGGSNGCVPCPPCDCKEMALDGAACNAYCTNMSESCKLRDDNFVYRLIFLLEGIFPPNIVAICLASIAAFGLYVLSMVFNSLLNSKTPVSAQGRNFDERDQYLNLSPTAGANGTNGVAGNGAAHPTTPRAPFSTNGDRPFFAPSERSNRVNGSTNGSNLFSPGTPGSARHYGEPMGGTFESPPLITPSKKGDRRRTPYSGY